MPAKRIVRNLKILNTAISSYLKTCVWNIGAFSISFTNLKNLVTYNVWSYNGHVYFRISESSDKLIIQHYEDIDYLLYYRESKLEVDGR